jgi:hypothetical protein
MYELFHHLIEKCEVGLRIDDWHLSAKGPLGVGTLLIIVLLLLRCVF